MIRMRAFEEKNFAYIIIHCSPQLCKTLMTKPNFLNSHYGIRVYNRIISTCSDALLYMRRDLFVLLERTIHQFDNGCTRTINVIHSVMASVDIPDHHSPKQTANNQNLSSRV